MEEQGAAGGLTEEEAEETRGGKEGEEGERRWEWWSWGAGTHGQLGTGAFQDELLPNPLPPPSLSPLRHLACGGSHSVAALSTSFPYRITLNYPVYHPSLSLSLSHTHTRTQPPIHTLSRAHTHTHAINFQALFGFLRQINNQNQQIAHGIQLQNVNSILYTYIPEGSGEALTWGNGSSGQLGHGDLQKCCKPAFVKELQYTKIEIVSAGWSHTAFISEDNKLFTCGSGGYGQLGHGNYDSCSIPKMVMCFSSKKVFHAACGMRHTLVLVDSGKGTASYAFGSSKKGQLGIGSPEVGACESKRSPDVNHKCHPHILESLNGCQISSVYANGDHSAALNDYGDLYAWGRGFGTTSNILLPSKIIEELRFCQVALGWNHLLALTYDGQVYATGSKWHGPLNAIKKPMANEHSSSRVSEVILNQFEPLKESSVRWVAAGSEHSAAILSDGSVVSWGWGEHGQLGLGTTSDQSCPENVADLPKMLNSQVYCGCGFTFLCKTH